MRTRSALTLLLPLVALIGTGPAWARFELEDTDQLDPEEHYNTETYNDKLSYRAPFDWDDLWAGHSIGLRVNAGSLNATRFDYQEDVKINFNERWDAGAVGFGFKQSRREDVLERREDREVRVNWRLLDALTLAVLGDGGADKEYGDLGGALGWWLGPQMHGEVFYWSVDHFYSTKKEFADDERSRPARTIGTRGLWQSGSSKVSWSYENDLPMTWHRASSGYDYAAARRAGTVRAETGELTDSRWFGQVDVETKEETKTTLVDSQIGSLKRRSGIYELGVQRRTAAGHDQAAGLLHIERFARYEPLATTARSEAAWYLTDHWQWSGRHYAQLGLHTNHVMIHEGREFRATEAKAQTAWDYRLSDTVRALLNCTWDIDQIGRDFPYGKKRQFRPWGGGDIQFIAVF